MVTSVNHSPINIHERGPESTWKPTGAMRKSSDARNTAEVAMSHQCLCVRALMDPYVGAISELYCTNSKFHGLAMSSPFSVSRQHLQETVLLSAHHAHPSRNTKYYPIVSPRRPGHKEHTHPATLRHPQNVYNHLPNNPSPPLLLHILAPNLHHRRPLLWPTTSLHTPRNLCPDPLLGERATATLRAVALSIAEVGLLAHGRLAAAAVSCSEGAGGFRG